MVAKQMGIDLCIYRGEMMPTPIEPSKRLADTMEAIIGAVYLDRELDMARPVLSRMGLA